MKQEPEESNHDFEQMAKILKEQGYLVAKPLDNELEIRDDGELAQARELTTSSNELSEPKSKRKAEIISGPVSLSLYQGTYIISIEREASMDDTFAAYNRYLDELNHAEGTTSLILEFLDMNVNTLGSFELSLFFEKILTANSNKIRRIIFVSQYYSALENSYRTGKRLWKKNYKIYNIKVDFTRDILQAFEILESEA